MKRHWNAVALTFIACLTFAALSYAKADEKLPHLKNHFEGKVVFVSCPDVPTIVMINPRLFAYYGRITLMGDQICINPGSSEDSQTYKRTGGTAYVAWNSATVCIAYDATSIILSDNNSQAVPNPGPPSPAAPTSDSVPDVAVPDSVPTKTTIDPSIDAGMMADEFERTQRLTPKKVERSDAAIETNPKSNE